MFGSPSNDSNIKLNTMARLPACHDVQPSLSLIRISQADFLLGFPRLRRAAGLPGERILCPYPANYTRPRDVVGQYAHAVASKLSTHVRVLMAPWILSPGVPALAAPHTCTHTHTNKQTNKQTTHPSSECLNSFAVPDSIAHIRANWPDSWHGPDLTQATPGTIRSFLAEPSEAPGQSCVH